ncbi:MAG: diaminopimelate epimerase [Desulfohalobiaceae bacterium]
MNRAGADNAKFFSACPMQEIFPNTLPVPFYKMQGSGNDFVIILNDQLQLQKESMALWASRICQPSLGVGADGLIFLHTEPQEKGIDYRWHFFNSDGSRAEMCGNGSRCAAWLAYHLGLAGKNHILGTDAGPIQAHVSPEQGQVKVQLTSPKDLYLDIELSWSGQELLQVHYVDTGVPHVVYFSEDPDQLDIQALAPGIRYHSRFAPQGANVNLVGFQGPEHLYVRTYERGVEGETLACGTGAAAAAVVARELGLCGDQIRITTSGQEELNIFLQKGLIYLQGAAVLVFAGYLNPWAVQLETD